MMITAIPMNDDRVAGHFTKALSIAFIDERGEELSRFANPALNTNCAGKVRLLDLLTEHQAQRVVVRNIGTQMLARLLARQLAVFQISDGNPDMAALVASAANGLLPVSQARPSPKHDAKGKHGCDCHHESEELGSLVKQEKCCRQDAIHAPCHRGNVKCHSEEGQQNNTGHGHGKCCHN